MTITEARQRIAEKFGSELVLDHGSAGAVFKFRSTADADECKAVLDALHPEFTGAVFGMARLLVGSPS